MVRVESDKGKVQVSIANTGEGIAPKDLSQLLSDIHSPAIHRGEHPDSSGLGLAIVKQVLALHGVRLQARSTMGRGTTFSFTLAASVTHVREMPVMEM